MGAVHKMMGFGDSSPDSHQNSGFSASIREILKELEEKTLQLGEYSSKPFASREAVKAYRKMQTAALNLRDAISELS